MPYKEKEITKLYYTISEVSKQFGVSNSLLRYWEGEFEQLSPKKGAKGMRYYTQKDIDVIKLIYHLVKEQGHTLDGAKTKLKEGYTNLAQKTNAIEKLESLRDFLNTLKEEL